MVKRWGRRPGDRVDWPWVWGVFVVVFGLFVAVVVGIVLSGELELG
jgi:hypothetical protein